MRAKTLAPLGLTTVGRVRRIGSHDAHVTQAIAAAVKVLFHVNPTISDRERSSSAEYRALPC
jgi:hypothetical protein